MDTTSTDISPNMRQITPSRSQIIASASSVLVLSILLVVLCLFIFICVCMCFVVVPGIIVVFVVSLLLLLCNTSKSGSGPAAKLPSKLIFRTEGWNSPEVLMSLGMTSPFESSHQMNN